MGDVELLGLRPTELSDQLVGRQSGGHVVGRSRLLGGSDTTDATTDAHAPATDGPPGGGYNEGTTLWAAMDLSGRAEGETYDIAL